MITCPDCGRQWPDGARFCMECGTVLATLPGAPERRLVTTVLCDLPGLTAAIDAAHPEEVPAILHAYHAVVGGIIDGHGGAVDKIFGDDVAGVFGLLVARKDDPVRAVRAALRVVGELKKLARPRRRPSPGPRRRRYGRGAGPPRRRPRLGARSPRRLGDQQGGARACGGAAGTASLWALGRRGSPPASSSTRRCRSGASGATRTAPPRGWPRLR